MKFTDSKSKGGRPRFKPTKTQRRTVLIAVAAGLSEPETAAVIDVARATLRQYFPDELKNGRARAYVENLLRLDRAASRGSTSAMKFLATVFVSAGAHTPLGGKKLHAEVQAKTATTGTSWEEILRPLDGGLTDETIQ